MAFCGRHPKSGRSKLHAVEFGRQLDRRAIPALSHVGDYLRHGAVDTGAVAAAAREYRGQKFSELGSLRLENPGPHADANPVDRPVELFLRALDSRAELRQLRVERLVPAIQVIDAAELG